MKFHLKECMDWNS